ncbi:DUF624 domain-containing protein [Glycomyces sp. A-F 0318]|uniref:DUF624 domain-containing protein n=1 Tax=Glycomyces amatae TaxID=2881355 RepID=UPI001E3151C7|nr:DUF624 domain-containing protein [Glycomyces amatae]MCD0447294.1 DUF624 domain-containing protein [Glycomyces amatae]
MTTLDTPRGPAAPARDGSRVERWYGRLDAVAFVGMLNLLVIAFTLAGGIVLGWAPALAAATACSRTRLRGDTQRLVRAFAAQWRRRFAHANLLAVPSGAALASFAVSLTALSGRPGTGALQAALAAAAAVCLAHLVLALAMDAHYELRRARCLRLSWAFLVRFPGAPLLLIATTALITAVTAFVPGLLPVLSIGVWVHLCTALCLSFYAANDRNLQGAA